MWNFALNFQWRIFRNVHINILPVFYKSHIALRNKNSSTEFINLLYFKKACACTASSCNNICTCINIIFAYNSVKRWCHSFIRLQSRKPVQIFSSFFNISLCSFVSHLGSLETVIFSLQFLSRNSAVLRRISVPFISSRCVIKLVLCLH